MADARRRVWTKSLSWQDFVVMALSGAAAGLGHPPFSLAVLTIVAMAMAFWYARNSQNCLHAFWMGFALGAGYFANSIHWIVEPFLVDPVRHGWIAPFAIVTLSLVLGSLWGAAFAIGRWIGPAVWPLVVLLTLAEMVRSYLFGGFPWGLPGYVLVDHFGGQAAAWVGPHGLNLIIWLVAWGLSFLFLANGWVRYATGGVLILALPILMLSVPSATPSVDGPPIVRLVQPNAPQNKKWDPAHTWRFLNRAISFTADGDSRPDLIVWPETSVPLLLHEAKATLEIIGDAAGGAPVVLGINRVDGERFYNSAVVLDPTGTVRQIYDKHHLVPFGEYVPLGNLMAMVGLRGFASQHGEGYSAGPGPRLLDLGKLGKALPLICYEAVFPQGVNAALERPSMLLQITNDAWFGSFSGPYQHLAQARMRAIEQGLPMIRVANTGVSAVIDGAGRVVGSLPLSEEGFLDVAIPATLDATLYSRTGDLPLIVLVMVLTVGLLMRVQRNGY